METFIMAIVLMTALVIGSDHNLLDPDPVDPDRSHALGTGPAQNQSIDREPAPDVCNPDHHPIIQRDLTQLGNRQVNDDGP